MIQATPDITAQLMRIKHTFQIAGTFAARGDPVNRVIAAILMDYVAESALKTVYWAHPATAPGGKEVITFPDLLKAVADLTGAPPALPLRLEIDNLHRQRNATQHRNLLPSAEDVPRHAAYVEAFLRDIFVRFFAVDFDELTLASLVSDTELRTHTEEAERLVHQGRLSDAVAESVIALDKALSRATDALGVRAHTFLSDLVIAMDARQAGFTNEQVQVLKGLGRDLQQLRLEVGERLLIVAVGLDYAAHARFKAIAPRVWRNINGEINVDHSSESYSLDQAKEILNYSLNQIIGLETLGALAVSEASP